MPLRMIGGRTARRSAALLTTAAMLAALVVGATGSPAAAARPSCGGKVATIVGTSRGETIVGTTRADVIVARGGDDIVRGGGGNDVICGGGGADQLVGQGGHDRLFGGAGLDTLYGGAGDDRLDGGAGTDTCYQGPGQGPRVSCERPATKVRQLVIGGPGSDQVGEPFWASLQPGGLGPWNIGSGMCYTGRIDYGASGIDEYRFALEFPLSDLPAGSSIVRARLSVNAESTAPSQGIYGYPGNGSISVADAIMTGPGVWFDAPVTGYHTVDVTAAVTPAVVTAGWAGFLQARSAAPAATWSCRAADAAYPRLTIDYRRP
jgi:hypothetical protein